MIEYLYNAVRATAGEDITITAKITNEAGDLVNDNCHLNFYSDKELIVTVEGSIMEELYQFTIPAEITTNLTGRYWYCICNDKHTKLNFKQPIYLV